MVDPPVPKESENSSKTTDLTLHIHNISKLKRWCGKNLYLRMHFVGALGKKNMILCIYGRFFCATFIGIVPKEVCTPWPGFGIQSQMRPRLTDGLKVDVFFVGWALQDSDEQDVLIIFLDSIPKFWTSLLWGWRFWNLYVVCLGISGHSRFFGAIDLGHL